MRKLKSSKVKITLKNQVEILKMDVNQLLRESEDLRHKKYMKKQLQMKLFRAAVVTIFALTTIVYIYDILTK